MDTPVSGFPEEILLVDGRVDIADYLRLEEVLHVAAAERASSQLCAVACKGTTWQVEQGHLYNQRIVRLFCALKAIQARHEGSM